MHSINTHSIIVHFPPLFLNESERGIVGGRDRKQNVNSTYLFMDSGEAVPG